MSKSILIIDTPESCTNCEIRFDDIYSNWCPYHNPEVDGVYKYVKQRTKPDWCPLKPMPEKRTIYPGDIGASAYEARGYNRCINEILGG